MKNMLSVVLLIGLIPASVNADFTVDMYAATPKGPGALVGTVTIDQNEAHAVFSLTLKGMQPFSMHGFHIHENASCGPGKKGDKIVPALAAGGHWDPANTGRHEGWLGQGHLGDLPRLEADANGELFGTISAPRIKDTAALVGRSLILHLNGDNYADKPKKLGGGGTRLFCGVIR